MAASIDAIVDGTITWERERDFKPITHTPNQNQTHYSHNKSTYLDDDWIDLIEEDYGLQPKKIHAQWQRFQMKKQRLLLHVWVGGVCKYYK